MPWASTFFSLMSHFVCVCGLYVYVCHRPAMRTHLKPTGFSRGKALKDPGPLFSSLIGLFSCCLAPPHLPLSSSLVAPAQVLSLLSSSFVSFASSPHLCSCYFHLSSSSYSSTPSIFISFLHLLPIILLFICLPLCLIQPTVQLHHTPKKPAIHIS